MFLWRFAGHYFAFVTDRVLDYGFPPSATEPEPDRMIADIWLSWVFPLFATMVIQSVASIQGNARAAASIESDVKIAA